MKLFIYGSLKRGEYNNPRCLTGQKFVREAETLPQYKLMANEFYPCMVSSMLNGKEIKGEIWDVDATCLSYLDAMERGAGYTRKPVLLKNQLEDESDVQTYLYLGSTSGLKDCGVEWSGKRSAIK